MTCKTCTASRETQGLWRMFDPACIFCGARLVQKIGRLQIGRTEATARRKQALADWMALGHSEKEIRALVKGPIAHAPESSSARRRNGV